MYTSFGVTLSKFLCGYHTALAGFRDDIGHFTISLLLSKAGTNPDKGGVSVALLNNLSKALEFTLLHLYLG